MDLKRVLRGCGAISSAFVPVHVQRSRHWLGPPLRCCQEKHRHCYCGRHFPSRTKVRRESVSRWARTIDPVHTIRLFCSRDYVYRKIVRRATCSVMAGETLTETFSDEKGVRKLGRKN